MDLGILGIDPVTALLLVGFVTGFVECAKAVVDKTWRKVAIIVVAGLSGGIVAPFIGLSIVTGIVGGFAASGAVTLVQNIGVPSVLDVEAKS